MSPARHRLRTLTRSHILVLVGSGVMVLFLVGSVLWAQFGRQQAQDETGQVAQQRDQVAEQRDAAAGQAQSLAEQIKAACSSGDLVGPVCEQAEQVAAAPAPPPPLASPATGEPGRPPTAAEIQAAVDAYLVEHPPACGRPPTPAEVAAAVAEYLIANPPTPGRPPTAEEISAAVAQYFADNPVRDGRDGKDGEDGEPGPPPTAEEIDSAVAAWIDAHPDSVRGPKGDEGEPGPTCPVGTSLEPVQFASGESGLGCVVDEQPSDTTTAAPTPTTEPGETTTTDE